MNPRLVTGALFVGVWVVFVGTAAAQSDGSLVVNMSALSRNPPAPTSPWPRLIHQHVSPTLPSGRGAVAPLTAPAATTTPLAPSPPTAPLNTFEEQGQTDWIPPNTNGAVSAAFVMTTVNNTITVRTRAGQQLS